MSSIEEQLKAIELKDWDTPQELTGRTVKTIEELRKLFPANANYTAVYRRDDKHTFDRFSRKYADGGGMCVDVAYHCRQCDKIVIGPPEIKTTTEQAGKKALDYNCTNCREKISELTLD